MQLVLTIFYLIWLIVVLVVLALIYWSTMRYIHKMEKTMIENRTIVSEAALKSAEAAARLAEMLEEKEHHA